MNNSNIKICVVGAGNWGKNHIRSLSELNSLFAIVESNENQIHQIKKKYSDRFQFEVSKPDPTKSLFVLDGLKLFDQIFFVFKKRSSLVIFQKFRIFSISFLISISPGKLV